MGGLRKVGGRNAKEKMELLYLVKKNQLTDAFYIILRCDPISDPD